MLNILAASTTHHSSAQQLLSIRMSILPLYNSFYEIGTQKHQFTPKEMEETGLGHNALKLRKILLYQ